MVLSRDKVVFVFVCTLTSMYCIHVYTIVCVFVITNACCILYYVYIMHYLNCFCSNIMLYYTFVVWDLCDIYISYYYLQHIVVLGLVAYCVFQMHDITESANDLLMYNVILQDQFSSIPCMDMRKTRGDYY